MNSRWRILYERTAPALALFCLLASLFASVGVFYNDHENGQQDRARIAGQAELLACFDRYSQASSATSQAVRVASAAVSEATVDRDRALDRYATEFAALLKAIIAGTVNQPNDIAPLLAALTDLDTAGDHLDAAQAELSRVRVDNPVPDPPSEFCAEGDPS